MLPICTESINKGLDGDGRRSCGFTVKQRTLIVKYDRPRWTNQIFDVIRLFYQSELLLNSVESFESAEASRTLQLETACRTRARNRDGR